MNVNAVEYGAATAFMVASDGGCLAAMFLCYWDAGLQLAGKDEASVQYERASTNYLHRGVPK
jgi:hypothetical protein